MTGELTGPEWRGPELRADPLLLSVAAGRAPEEPLNILIGLLGPGSADHLWRLYLTQEFDEYVEFDASVVVHTQPVNEGVPLAGTSVWVRSGATLRYTQISSRQVQSDFLQGGITSAHLSGARASLTRAATVAETGYACTRNYVCSTNPHIPACQERSDLCGPVDPPGSTLCPTGPFVQNC